MQPSFHGPAILYERMNSVLSKEDGLKKVPSICLEQETFPVGKITSHADLVTIT